MTKTQMKNALKAIQNKATKLFLVAKGPDGRPLITLNDVGKINEVLTRAHRKLK
jgi:hypothetical protein